MDAEAWIDYMATCLPLYNVQPSSFGPRRTWMNLPVIVHFNDAFSDLDLRDDLGPCAARRWSSSGGRPHDARRGLEEIVGTCPTASPGSSGSIGRGTAPSGPARAHRAGAAGLPGRDREGTVRLN